jgi:hypothetical protein
VILLPALMFFQAAAAQGPLPEVVTRPRLERNGGVDFHALVVPETVFVGQQATYQLGVFIDQDTRSRLRRNPEFIPPESRAMLAYDLPDPVGSMSVNRDGRAYEVHVFRRALFPLTAGRYTIAPARLAYTVPQGQSFFSREETFSRRSEAVTLVVVDVPAAGRPADWAGAVGVWKASARVDTARDRAGDPLVLTLRVEGTGNVTLLSRPHIDIPWANVVAANERVRLDSTPSAMRGSKEFDWLVTPRASGSQRVPAFRFSYFNPFSKRYESSATEPFTVQVAQGSVVAADSAAEPPAPAPEKPFPLRTEMGDEAPLPLGDLAVVRGILLLAPLMACAAWIVRKPRRVRAPRTPAERLRAMASPGHGGVIPAEVRTMLLDALRRRTGLDAASLTQPGAWARSLRLEGVTDETARETEVLIDELDGAAFGGTSAAGAAVASRAAALFARVDAEARRAPLARARRPAGAGAGLFAVVALTGIAGSLLAGDIERAREPFAAGIAAYTGADYTRAARLFEDASRAAPRVAATWANAGTASWAAADTAGAVVGWKHALRLDPLADDLRERLARVRAPQDVGVAFVPAIAARAPSALALLLWIAGWIAVARLCWQRRPALRLAIATLVVAGSAAAGARMYEERMEGRDLAVVIDPAPLRVLPALGAEGGAVPMVGEVARVVQRQGVWTRVSLDGERDGWIASERLAPLGNGHD